VTEFLKILAVDRAKYEKEGWHVRTILNNDPDIGIHSLLMVRPRKEKCSSQTTGSLLADRYRKTPCH
jgi:hypothetical protein